MYLGRYGSLALFFTVLAQVVIPLQGEDAAMPPCTFYIEPLFFQGVFFLGRFTIAPVHEASHPRQYLGLAVFFVADHHLKEVLAGEIG